MTEEKPIRYKKLFRDALAAMNEKLGFNIPESEIGALARETYHGGQTRIEPIDGKEYYVMNLPIIWEYHKQLAILQKQAQNRWDLKVLAVINERTGRNLPPEAAEKIRERQSFPGCKGWDDEIQTHFLYKKISEELENAGKMTKEARLLAEGKKVCGRCGGSGRYSFNLRDLDRCYGCGGSGVVQTKKKDGKGWHEDTPGHKRAAAKSKLKMTLREPLLVEKPIEPKVENPIELYGWKQESKQVWKGNGNNEIRIKYTRKKIHILVSTEYGHESDKVNTIEEAIESVNWFMKRRPQEKERDDGGN